MPSNTWIRAFLLRITVLGLAMALGAGAALAQQEGPQKPAPPVDTPAKVPTQQGQQQTGQSQQPPPPQVAISVQSAVVNVDAVVTDSEGNLVTGLKKENFRILDDGQPQQVTNFAPSEAPITMVMLVEFSKQMYGVFAYNAQHWAYEFLSRLNQKDWVALKTFDIKTTLQVDFTQNKGEIQAALAQLFVPSFTDSNLFDAVMETLDQLRDVKGKKSILVLASGKDTFSKHTLDQTYKRVKESDVTIFAVGVGEAAESYADMSGRQGPIGRLNYLQGKNQLTRFAEMTGGYAWFPQMQGELPSILNSVAAFLRNQYTLGFAPTTAPDAKYHKIKIEVVDEQGNPMMVPNKKGKPKNVVVYARQGYSAPSGAASD
jgi:VWFA-related protein